MLYFELGIVTILIVTNGLLSMSELAIVSARPARLAALAERRVKGSRRALTLASDPGKFLSTVQIGITLIGIFAGAFSGATLAQPLADVLARVPALAGIARPLGFGLVVVATTYVSLIVGELVPKKLALRNAEGIAALVSGPMAVLAAVGKPIVWFLRLSTEAVLGLLGLGGEAPSGVTEEEVKAMIAEGTDAGVFHEAERDLLEGVIRFADRPLRSIMVPRHAIAWIDAEDPIEDTLAEVLKAGHSRFPICTGDIDNVVGFVHVKDILELRMRGGSDLREVVREPLYVSESIPALRMIELFRSSGTHIAMVIDEYGSLEGLVTPTDILTGIAGDLPEGEPAGAAAVEREDCSWLLDGSLSVDAAARVLGVEDMSSDDYTTLAGMIIEELGHLPTPGEYVTLHGWCFEVVDLDGRRIDKVLARRPDAGKST
jgi:magnesium and cobalt exporter, CNNM family